MWLYVRLFILFRPLSLCFMVAYFCRLFIPSPGLAGEPPITIVKWTCEELKDEILVSGEVRNDGPAPVDVTAVAILRGIRGDLIKIGEARPAFPTLDSGQQSPFQVSAPRSRRIANCELAIKDTQTGKLIVKAMNLWELPGSVSVIGDSETGRRLFNGKGVCFGCHGKDGVIDDVPHSQRSDLQKMNPRPSNLRDQRSLRFRSPKEKFRVIKYGIPGTAMIPMELSDEDILRLLPYLDVLSGSIH